MDKPTLTLANANCLCGCGLAPSSSTSTYRQGHDARHAGIIARAMLDVAINSEDSDPMDELKKLPSPALRGKALLHFERLMDRHARAEARAQRGWTLGTAKKGRWVYPARRKGQVTQINTKRDGNGEWVALDRPDRFEAA